MPERSTFFETPIEFLKGVGPAKAELLQKELGISKFGELAHYYPYRYEDKSKFYKISELTGDSPMVQIKGRVKRLNTTGFGRKKRLVGIFADDSGEIELVWFKGIQWVIRKVKPGVDYVVFGKPTTYGSKLNIAHPDIDILTGESEDFVPHLHPVYSTTENLRKNFLDTKALAKLQKRLIPEAFKHIRETLPDYLVQKIGLLPLNDALLHIHFPHNKEFLKKASYRLKFEEFFFIQLKLLMMKIGRQEKYRGFAYKDTALLKEFYEKHLPFELTEAQKRVLREIYHDMKSGVQMNRLLQGDVGSGKTIVAFITMLVVIGSGDQAVLMAPTEILAIQHYHGLKDLAAKVGLKISLLTGSTKAAEGKIIRRMLKDGDLNLVVGTHALIEERVQFKQLGLAVVDEQHRFGVAQRSKLWQKNKDFYPHVLVMTATPIPRTLAMTLYGDLDVSVIDELPKGRRPIQTVHRFDANRLKVNQFIRDEVKKGRQVYVVYPLIEESSKMDLKDLMDGYESVCRAFPDFAISILHGRMKAEDKDFEMQRFVKGETNIMVATTVIEVGVDIPNASVMIIENAERFGLAQLHQLRGRVGRGAEQSFCILMTKYELSKEARVRIETMVRTNNGFDIADVDLKLRGPGDMTGTQQSGIVGLKIADISKDAGILKTAREVAKRVLESDPKLEKQVHGILKSELVRKSNTLENWSRVS